MVNLEGFYLAALQMSEGLGGVQLGRLVDAFGTARAVWEAREADLLASGAFVRQKVGRDLAKFCRENEGLPERLAETCRKKNISACTRRDEAYPLYLKQIFNAPQVLFCRGRLIADEACVAMVGARRASPYGKSVAEALAMEIAAAGMAVASGAARGIDTASHRGALKKGRTIAVLGCGVDVAYPAENRRLLDEIAERGAVVSEYAPGTQPIAAFFPARNRIISGISQGTVVVEAAERSGSLITAELALGEGRDVFAVPGSIYSTTSKGCHRLIQQGAKLVAGAEDILEEYRWKKTPRPEADGQEEPPGLSPGEQEIYRILSWNQPQTADEIIEKLHGNTANISFLLLQMQLKGLIVENGLRAYVRAVKEGIL